MRDFSSRQGGGTHRVLQRFHQHSGRHAERRRFEYAIVLPLDDPELDIGGGESVVHALTEEEFDSHAVAADFAREHTHLGSGAHIWRAGLDVHAERLTVVDENAAELDVHDRHLGAAVHHGGRDRAARTRARALFSTSVLRRASCCSSVSDVMLIVNRAVTMSALPSTVRTRSR